MQPCHSYLAIVCHSLHYLAKASLVVLDVAIILSFLTHLRYPMLRVWLHRSRCRHRSCRRCCMSHHHSTIRKGRHGAAWSLHVWYRPYYPVLIIRYCQARTRSNWCLIAHTSLTDTSCSPTSFIITTWATKDSYLPACWVSTTTLCIVSVLSASRSALLLLPACCSLDYQ